MRDRERLHTLVDALPEGELHVALRFVEFLGAEVTPLWSLRDAPVDDEPLTAEDEAALVEADRDLAEGRILAHDEARRLLLGKA